MSDTFVKEDDNVSRTHECSIQEVVYGLRPLDFLRKDVLVRYALGRVPRTNEIINSGIKNFDKPLPSPFKRQKQRFILLFLKTSVSRQFENSIQQVIPDRNN